MKYYGRLVVYSKINMKRLLLLIIFMWFKLSLYAQITKLDSVQAQLATVKDTVKVNLLLDLSKAYLGKDREKVIYFSRQAQKLAQKHRFARGEAYALKNMGLVYFVEGNYAEVLKYWQSSLQIFSSIHDKTGMGNMLGNIGAVYANQGFEAKAIEYHLRSLKVAEEIGDKMRISTTLSNIGAVYANNLDNKLSRAKALEYYKKALNISEDLKDETLIGATSANIGEIYLAQGDDKLAQNYFEKSIINSEKSGNKEKVAYALHQIGNLYSRQKNYNQALVYQQKAYNTAANIQAKLEMVQALNGMGKIFNQQNQSDKALVAFSQAKEIALEIGSNLELKNSYEGLSLAYAATQNYKKAFEHRLLLSAVNDTLFNTETNKKIVSLQANYESEKKQAQINLLTKDQALQRLELQKQRVVKNTSLVGLGFILVLALVLFMNTRNKAKANKLLTLKNTEISEQKEEIASQRDNLEQTYNTLVNAQDQLVQSEKMASLGQLTAGIAHEINNPINFVSSGIDSLRTNFSDIMDIMAGYLALNPEADNKEKLRHLQKLNKELEVAELMEESEQLLRSIKNGANRTKEIVKSLRNFTRLDESSLKITDIHEGLDSTLVILNNLLKDRIKVIKDYGDLDPIICYPGQLNQVFMNILNNAVQAIKNEGTIVIRTYTENGWAIVKIKDNGTGMPEEVKKHIFDPFFTTKDVGEGTGLGLSISYGIIQKHNGKIEVESKPGQGTEFTIRIPLVLSESPHGLAVATT